MPLTGRHYDNPEDLLDSTTDTFLRWASEFDLIEMQVDEQGEVFFTPTGCEHDQEVAPAPLPTKRTGRRRLAMVAIPVMATMALAGTARAAYIIASPEVTYVAQSGERIHIRGGLAHIEKGPALVADAPHVKAVRGTAAKATPSPTSSAHAVGSKAASHRNGTPSLGAKSKKEGVTGKPLPAPSKAEAPESSPILGVPGVVTIKAPALSKPTPAPEPVKVEATLPGDTTVTLTPETVKVQSLPRPLPDVVVEIPPVEPLKDLSAAVGAR